MPSMHICARRNRKDWRNSDRGMDSYLYHLKNSHGVENSISSLSKLGQQKLLPTLWHTGFEFGISKPPLNFDDRVFGY